MQPRGPGEHSTPQNCQCLTKAPCWLLSFLLNVCGGARKMLKPWRGQGWLVLLGVIFTEVTQERTHILPELFWTTSLVEVFQQSIVMSVFRMKFASTCTVLVGYFLLQPTLKFCNISFSSRFRIKMDGKGDTDGNSCMTAAYIFWDLSIYRGYTL